MTKLQNPHLSEQDRKSTEYVELVQQAAAGSREAMERLLMRAQEVAYRFSLLVCGQPDDAEEVMQDALLKTYQYVDRIRDPGAFRTWLYTTVRNACFMKRRKRSGEPRTLLSVTSDDGSEASAFEVQDPRPGPDQMTINAWVGERLQAALQALPPVYRVVVVLREVEGLSTREAANVLGISEHNVKTRLHRARTLLRKQLGDL